MSRKHRDEIQALLLGKYEEVVKGDSTSCPCTPSPSCCGEPTFLPILSRTQNGLIYPKRVRDVLGKKWLIMPHLHYCLPREGTV